MSLTATKTTQTVERRQRGIFGKLWLYSFWAFQAFMIWFTFINVGAFAEVTGSGLAECVNQEYQGACEAGTVIGAGLASGMIATVGWFAWFLGTIILGLFVLMTRGNKVVTYVENT